jgi:hypothetical protein
MGLIDGHRLCQAPHSSENKACGLEAPNSWDLETDGRIMLKLIIKKSNMKVWTRFNCIDCGLAGCSPSIFGYVSILEKHTASIFMTEDEGGGSMYFTNDAMQPKYHVVQLRRPLSVFTLPLKL